MPGTLYLSFQSTFIQSWFSFCPLTDDKKDSRERSGCLFQAPWPQRTKHNLVEFTTYTSQKWKLFGKWKLVGLTLRKSDIQSLWAAIKRESPYSSGPEVIQTDGRRGEISSPSHQEGAFHSYTAAPLILTSQHKRNRGFMKHLAVYYTLQLFLFYRIFCPNSTATTILEKLTSVFIYQVTHTTTSGSQCNQPFSLDKNK